MSHQLQHANESELKSLLFGEDRSAAYRATVTHVETCESCRTRLDELSGSVAFDLETSEMLSDFQLTSAADDIDLSHSADAAILNYLAPPSHPEMLGRIGRYEIERVIGRGGMGVVFKGFDTELNRPVAIKVLAQHLSYSGAARQRFAREAKAAAAVVHEHVVAIHNVETEGDMPFLVMPYIGGESLQARVDREGMLGVKEILRIGIQAAAGLQAAHDQGVIHRDIKPGNILLEEGVERALVMDFGLAQTIDDATLTQTGILTGTPSYMSPEQANGKPIDTRSDLFSLGSVLYFMAAGHSPFRADRAMGILHRICNDPHKPVWQEHPEIPDDLSDVIDRLLEKNPAYRFASAKQVQEALQTTLANLQHPKPRYGVSMKRFVRRHRKAWRTVAWGTVLCFLTTVIALRWNSIPDFWARPKEVVQQPATSTYQAGSIATWQQASQQASSAEAQEWAHSMQQITTRLDQLEYHVDREVFEDSDWNAGMQWLQQRLQQLDPNTNPTPVR